MAIVLDHVNHIYEEGTSISFQALTDINLVIPDGQFIGLIGHTGSGKSTLVQHLNGLLAPTSGAIYYNGEDINEKGYSRKALRSKVGLVFQYPEHQLFETDVFTDVCFGPKNLGLDRKEFELSGGQKRRAAIAGVLAMKPEVLILDEPTAGLDPKGRDEILDQVAKLREETGMTVILVSHSMEDVARYVDRIIVMNKSRVMFDDAPKMVFRHYKELEEVGLAAPQITYIMQALKAKGLRVDTDITSVEEARDAILAALHRG